AAGAPGAVEAAGADHEIARVGAANEVLAGQLAEAVNAHRPRRIGFREGIGSRRIEAEHVIGTEVDELAVRFAAGIGQCTDAPGIDREGGRRLRFREIDEVVRGAVNEDSRANGVDGRGDAVGYGEVDVGASEWK